MKNESALAVDKQGAAVLRDADQRFTHQRRVFTEVLGDHGSLPWRTWMVSWVRKAGEPLEQDFELEEVLDFAVDLQVSQPCFARQGLFTAKATRFAQQIVVCIALFEGAFDRLHDCGTTRYSGR